MVRAVVDGRLTKAATAREYHTTYPSQCAHDINSIGEIGQEDCPDIVVVLMGVCRGGVGISH